MIDACDLAALLFVALPPPEQQTEEQQNLVRLALLRLLAELRPAQPADPFYLIRDELTEAQESGIIDEYLRG